MKVVPIIALLVMTACVAQVSVARADFMENITSFLVLHKKAAIAVAAITALMVYACYSAYNNQVSTVGENVITLPGSVMKNNTVVPNGEIDFGLIPDGVTIHNQPIKDGLVPSSGYGYAPFDNY